jgi:hypothetical protein
MVYQGFKSLKRNPFLTRPKQFGFLILGVTFYSYINLYRQESLAGNVRSKIIDKWFLVIQL